MARRKRKAKRTAKGLSGGSGAPPRAGGKGRGRPTLYDPTPSPEATRHRLARAAGADPAKSALPLDWLAAHGLIGEAEARAGHRFRAAHRTLFGAAAPAPMPLVRIDRASPGPAAPAAADPPALARAEAWHKAVWAALGDRQRALFLAVVIAGHWPRIAARITAARPPDPAALAELQTLRQALTTAAQAIAHTRW